MRQRVISAAALVPIVLVPYLLGEPWLVLGIASVALLASMELARLLAAAGLPLNSLLVVAGPPVAVLGLAWRTASPGLAIAVAGGAFIVAAIDGFRRSDPRIGFATWMTTAFGMLYGALLAFLAGILVVAPGVPPGAPLHGLFDGGRLWLAILILAVWSYDSLAYVTGRVIGRGRFFNHISPSKTWSGVVGGTLGAVVVTALLSHGAGQGALEGGVLGLLIALTAQGGDLAESLLKRAAGAKDSGSLIPGHGGVLDRVDSLLFAAPATFGFLILLAQLRGV